MITTSYSGFEAQVYLQKSRPIRTPSRALVVADPQQVVPIAVTNPLPLMLKHWPLRSNGIDGFRFGSCWICVDFGGWDSSNMSQVYHGASLSGQVTLAQGSAKGRNGRSPINNTKID